MGMKRIEVRAIAGMTREQVRMTNAVANTLVREHGTCLDCAINFAVAVVWCAVRGQERPEHNPIQAELCSAACAGAMREFFEQTLGKKPDLVSVDELPFRTR